MTDTITLKDGDMPRGFVDEARICMNCKHRRWDDMCRRHVYETEGALFVERSATCAEWRGR
jgi:hypothetical protein